MLEQAVRRQLPYQRTGSTLRTSCLWTLTRRVSLVLRYKLVKQKNADALVNVKLVTFAGQVMETYHRLNTMPNVNVMAVFQAFILEYESLTTR